MRQYRFKVNGHSYDVGIGQVSGNTADVIVNGVQYTVEMETEEIPSAQTETAVSPVAPVTKVLSSASSGGKTICAPLPGVIVNVNVKVGDLTGAGQEVAVLEAMKMENSIEAETGGTVTAVHVTKGDSVLEGAPIVTIG